jgi:hypothetical protein
MTRFFTRFGGLFIGLMACSIVRRSSPEPRATDETAAEPCEDRMTLTSQALTEQAAAVSKAETLSRELRQMPEETVLRRFCCRAHLLQGIAEAADQIVALDATYGGILLIDLRPAADCLTAAFELLSAGNHSQSQTALTHAQSALVAAERFATKMVHLHEATQVRVSQRQKAQIAAKSSK